MSDLEAHAKAYYESHGQIGIGAQFMAVTFDAIFCGILICQVTHWLPHWKKDPSHIRGIVLFGTLAAFGTTIFTWVNYFTSFVTNFGQYSRFASLSILGWYALLDMLTVVPVQLVFGERSIKINGRSPWVIFLDGFFILGTITCAIGVIITTRDHTIFDATLMLKCFMLAWPCVCLCTHLTLTSTILYGLLKSRSPNREINKVIDRVIYMSLESQIPGTIFAIIITTLLASNPASPVVPCVIVAHPKVFMIGCLAMINARHTWHRNGKVPTSLLNKTQTLKTSSSSFPDSTPSQNNTFSSSTVEDDEGPSTPTRILSRDDPIFRNSLQPPNSKSEVSLKDSSDVQNRDVEMGMVNGNGHGEGGNLTRTLTFGEMGYGLPMVEFMSKSNKGKLGKK